MQRQPRARTIFAIALYWLSLPCFSTDSSRGPIQGATELPLLTTEGDPATVYTLDTATPDIRSQLQALPGLTLRSSGGLGAYTESSLRGGSGRQSFVLLNGVTLLTAGGEALNLSLLPTAALSSARVDTQSNSGLSGDLLLFSKPSSEYTHNTVIGGGVGSFGEIQMSGRYALPHDSGTLFVQARKAQNDFSLRNPLKPYDPNDPERLREEARQNASTRNVSGLWTRAGQLLLISDNVEQIPNPRNSGNNRAELRTQLMQAGLRLAGDHQVRLGYLNERFRDHEAQLAQIATDTSNQTYSAAWTHEAGPWAWESELSAFATRDSKRPQATLDAQRLRLQLARHWHVNHSGLRLASQLLWEGAKPTSRAQNVDISPGFDAWHILPFSAASTTLRLQYRERVPTFFERYGNRGLFQGNPKLRTEQALSLTSEWQIKSAFSSSAPLNIALFHRWLWHGITPQYNARGTGQSTNAAKAQVTGVTAFHHWQPMSAWSVRGRIDWQNTVDTSRNTVHGKQLPGRPEWVVNAQLEHQQGLWRQGYSFHFEDGAFYDSPNLLRAPTVREHTLYLAGPLRLSRGRAGGDDPRWRVEACNLTDNRHARFNGFPEPGRHYRLSLEIPL